MADEQQDAFQRRYYWPNKLGRIYLLSLEDVMGKNGVNAVLNQARLRHLINNLPPNTLDLGWSFEEMAALNLALEELHGPLGGRGLAVRAGRASLYHFLEDLGAIMGIADVTFRLLPLGITMKAGLNAIADTFNKTSDQIVRVEEREGQFLFYVDRCPVCWGRSAEEPVCYALLGLLQEAMHWVTGGKNIRVVETACLAMGNSACIYEIEKRPLD